MTHLRSLLLLLVGCTLPTTLACGPSQATSSETGGQESDTLSRAEFQLTPAQEEAHREKARAWFDGQPGVIAPWTKVLSGQDVRGMRVEAGRLISSQSTERLNRLVPGDLLISAHVDQDVVFLRRVLSTRRVGEGIELVTQDVGLDSVVMKGSLTPSPTEVAPERHRDQLMVQGFGSPEPPADAADWFSRLDRYNDQDRIGSGTFELVAKGPYYQSRDPESTFDVRFQRSWFRNQTGTVEVEGRQVRTSCDEVTEALDYIQGTSADAEACRQAYDAWTEAGQITSGMTSSGYVRHVTGSAGEPRLQCTDEGYIWNSYYQMPHGSEVRWAQENCGGAIDHASIRIEYGTDIGLQQFGFRVTGGVSGTFDHRSASGLPNPLQYRRYFVLFASWIPVVLQFNAKFLDMRASIRGEAEIQMGYNNLNLRTNNIFELRYAQENGDIRSLDSWERQNTRTRDLSSERYGTVQLTGTAEVEVDVIDLDLLVYGVGGLYLKPLSVYARADAGAVRESLSGNLDLCPLGTSVGMKSSFGIRGRIPFTSFMTEWQFASLDTCGTEPRNSRAYYEQEQVGCRKECLTQADPREGPLQVRINWDERTDVDLFIDLPEGHGADIGYTRPSIGDLVLQNDNGCIEGGCAPRGPYEEKFEWTQENPAPRGDYVVKASNRGDQDAQVRVTVVGEGQSGRVRTVTVPAGSRRAIELYSFSLD